MTSPVPGTPDDLRKVLEAFESRTAVVESLAHEVTSLVHEVRDLRGSVEARPDRLEIEGKRRRWVLTLIIVIVGVMFFTDHHTETCGPGARTERVVNAFLSGETNPRVLRRLAEPSTSIVCDIAYPLHSHRNEPYPSNESLIGVLLYVVFFGGAAYWAIRPTLQAARERSQGQQHTGA